MENTILAGIIIMLCSLSGILFSSTFLKKFFIKNLHYLVSLSAGVFFVISFFLALESIEHGETTFFGLLPIFFGSLFTWLIFKLIPQTHHHHEEDGAHTHDTLDARRIVFGDALHNIGDGVLLMTSFSIDAHLGIATTIGVVLHEILQEISEFFVMKEAGWSTKKALITNFTTSGTIFIGIFGAYVTLEIFEHLEGILLGISSGVFLIVVFQDLIPHSIKNALEKNERGHTMKHLLCFFVGVVIMSVLNFNTEHSHEESDLHNKYSVSESN